MSDLKLTFRFKGGKGSGNFGHAGRPGQIGGSAPGRMSGVSITPRQERVWTGAKVDATAEPIPTTLSGPLGEEVAIQALSAHKDTQFITINQGVNNAPIDVAGDHMAIEVKTGLNTNSSQYWRTKIGGAYYNQEEKAMLKKMSAAERKEYNAHKLQAIIDRKHSMVESMSAELGEPVNPFTVGVIMAYDGSAADVFLVPGFHKNVSWKGIDEYYVGSYDIAIAGTG